MGNVLSKNIDASDSIAKTGASDSIAKTCACQAPQNKRIIRVVVEEDLFEQIDDAHCDGPEEPNLVEPSIQPADESHLALISKKTSEASSSAVTHGIVSNVVSSPASEETSAAIFPQSAPVEKVASLPSESNKEAELKIESSSSDAFPASASTANSSGSVPVTNTASSLISITSSTSGAPNSSSVFGCRLQSPKLSTPAFGSSALTSPSPSTGLAFCAPATSSTLSVFNNPPAFSFTTASPSILSSPSVIQPWFGNPARGFGEVATPDQMSVAATPVFPVFGQKKASYTPPPFGQTAYSIPSGFGFGSPSSGAPSSSSVFSSSWQSPKLSTSGFGSSALMEDNMDESEDEDDILQTSVAAPPSFPVFGQQMASSTPSAFGFGSQPNPFMFGGQQPNQAVAGPPGFPVIGQQMASYTPPAFGGQPAYSTPSAYGFGSQPNPFMFRQQQNQAAVPQQSPSPFQTNQFNPGVSFSFGSGGGRDDMSGQKILKTYRNKNWKK